MTTVVEMVENIAVKDIKGLKVLKVALMERP